MRRTAGSSLLLGAALNVAALAAAQVPSRPPDVLPSSATVKLAASLDAARHHRHHVWRDTQPIGDAGTVNAYIEIPRGEARKYEFAMGENARIVDRVMPPDVGPFPINYGFVPQTVSYDGDPFDALVLGPPLPGGEIVRGRIVGLMLMEDEKGIDSKVVLSPLDAEGQPTHPLTQVEQDRIGTYFDSYKRHEPNGLSSVPGWRSPEDALAHVVMTHAFFRQCREASGSPCHIDR